MKNRAGFTLIEILIVLTIIGIALGVAYNGVRSSTVKGGVRSAVDAVMSLHAVAKQSAIQRGRTSMLVLSGSTGRAWVVSRKATGTGFDTVGGRVEDLAGRFGVTLRTTRDTFTFTPRGLGAETSGATIIISKQDFADTISVSASGRILR